MSVTRTRSRRSAKHSDIEKQVLLIEDQRSIAQMAAKMLYERWGCPVLIATSLAQVKTILAQGQHQFFVVVSDLNLPDAPSGEVIDVLIAAKLRVIAITGMYDEGLHDKIMSLGVVDYVLKNSINAYEYIVELVGRLHRNMQIQVLVVDDSQTFCSIISGMLQVQGLQVLTASNGVEALAVLALHPAIKLVLLDHEMPLMDGFDFLSSVRRTHARDRLAVIGMSGSSNSRMSAQFLKLGANDFICKPFSYEELVCRVAQNLEMQQSIESVRYIAYHDYLTGLYNRRAFFERGLAMFDQVLALGKPLAAAVIDIDFFKKINDTWGHDGGDVVLKHFAGLLGMHFKTDLVGRVGGEEFFLLFSDVATVLARCEAFRQQVAQSNIVFNDAHIAFTISIGITRLIPASLDEMFKLADENLYTAKKTGRNRIVLT